MLCVLSLLLSIGFLAVHLPAALLLGPMIAGIIFSMRGITLQLPRSAFLAAQAILGCMIAQNLTGSILTTLAANWPIVLAILLVTLLSSAIVGWLLVRYSSLPGNTGAWGSSPGGAAAMVAMAQDYGADIRLVAFMQYLRVLFVAGAAVNGRYGARLRRRYSPGGVYAISASAVRRGGRCWGPLFWSPA